VALNLRRSTPEKVLLLLAAFLLLSVIVSWRRSRQRDQLEWVSAPTALGRQENAVAVAPGEVCSLMIHGKPQSWRHVGAVTATDLPPLISLWRVGWREPQRSAVFATEERDQPIVIYLPQPGQTWARLERQ
jgi:hypothetical protein